LGFETGGFITGCLFRRIQKCTLERAQILNVFACPFDGVCEPRSAIETARVVAEALPFVRGRAQLTLEPQVLSLLCEPRT
jgi:hypothetical protein